MTTLQTHSARNPSSASPLLSGAQSARSSALDAPGFAGILDAFTEPDSLTETEPIESTSDQPSDESQKSDESDDASDTQAAQDESNEPAQSTDQAEDSEQTEESQSNSQPVSDTQTADRPEQPAEGASTQVNSAQDLVKLLNNAATIDLAALATQQLTGQTTATQAAIQPKSTQQHAQQSTQSSTPQPAQLQSQPPTTPATPTPIQPQTNQFRTLQSPQPNIAHLSADPAQSTANNTQPITTSAQQVRTPAAAQPNSTPTPQTAIATIHRSVLASQAIQASTTRVHSPEAATNQRKSDPFKSLTEIGASSKSKPLRGTESANSNAAGFDLGAQSDRSAQHATRLDAQDPNARTQEQALQRKQILSQVQRGLASIINTKGGTMKLRMTPEHLGQVNIKMTTKDGHVKIKIDAETDQARAALKSGLAELKSTMESRGIQVEELSIEQRTPNEFRLTDHALDSKSSPNQHDHQSSRDHDQKNQQHSPDDQPDHQGLDAQDSESPKPIWTELGLDAIA
ncbi:MAG: flagellar hook-length control protein FliK [Phycisphaerales bacterium]|nr:flagellar hook-length control protein FliK [Phycisphaerales bacterium]